MNELKIRCSGLGRLMSGKIGLSETETGKLLKFKEKEDSGKELTKIQAEEKTKLLFKLENVELPAGAKSYIEEIVEEKLYNFKEGFDTKQTQKGNLCEIDSINLFNEYFFTTFKKNEEHFLNDFITGTPDVYNDEEVIDFKTSWSKKTFPKTKRKAYSSLYEWQLRGYMMLLSVKKAKLVYCLIDTPEDLCEYEEDSLHNMKDLEPNKRITVLEFERDKQKEEEIIKRVKLAKEYASEYLNEIQNARP